MTKNDYRTLRVVKEVGFFDVGQDTTLVNNNARFVCSLDHWTTEWSREIEAYEEFKISNIQFVIQPRTMALDTNATANHVYLGEIPYLAARVVNPNSPVSSQLLADDVRHTPGFRFLPFNTKKRFVINATPGLKVRSTVIDDTSSASGNSVLVDRHIRMPWLKIDSVTKALDLAAIEIRKPRFDNATGQAFKFDVRCYATLRLRGNKDELVPPY